MNSQKRVLDVIHNFVIYLQVTKIQLFYHEFYKFHYNLYIYIYICMYDKYFIEEYHPTTKIVPVAIPYALSYVAVGPSIPLHKSCDTMYQFIAMSSRLNSLYLRISGNCFPRDSNRRRVI